MPVDWFGELPRRAKNAFEEGRNISESTRTSTATVSALMIFSITTAEVRDGRARKSDMRTMIVMTIP